MERDLKLNFDIEGNGLLHEITKVWCIVAQDEESEDLFVFHNFPQFDLARVVDPFDHKTYIIPKRNGSLEEGVRFLMGRGKSLTCHNFFGYDYFVMKKFFPFFSYPLRDCVDTLIHSKLQWYDRPTPKGCKGPHGLAAWGARIGINKPEVNDWTVMDPFKLHRCIEDVKIQTKTTKLLAQERAKLEEVVGVSLEESLAIEHRYRFEATIQELDGAPVDIPHMQACIEELDKLCEELRIQVEPHLPATIKVKGVRASAHEVATALGVANPPPPRYEIKEVKGEKVRVEVKKYYKPVTKWLTSSKITRYAATNGEEDTGFIFSKLKDARDYAKDSSTKGWKFPKSVTEEVVYNIHTCNHFGVEPEDYEGKGKIIDGPHTKIEWNESTMSQHAVVKDFLLSLGWKPTEWNFKKDSFGKPERDARGQLIKTTPKLTEDSFESLPEGVGKQIADFNTYAHRRKFIENPTNGEKGILNQVREDGRISCGINNFGTSTGRSSHSVWVNAAGVGALYGEKIRQIIRVQDDKYRLVGADMKSAQLSIAAYYANNYDYYMAVADGQETDADGKYIGMSGHCVNARAFGLVTDEEWKRAVETQDEELLHSIMLRRKLSKGGTFATIFGASGKKIAQTIKISESEGEASKQRFLQAIGLDEPIVRLTKMMHKYKRGKGGYIELPFGYWAYCQQEHKLFNYLDQGTEGVCQKVAVIHFKDWLAKEVKAGNIDARKILDYHDEFMCESHEDCAEEVGKAMCRAYQYASDAVFEWHKEKSQWFSDLTFAFNLDGGFKIGYDYLDVH